MARERKKREGRKKEREDKEKMRLKALINQSGGNIRSAGAYLPP